MVDTPAVFPAWPGGAEAAVALTFDVDGEAAWLGEGPQSGRRLTLLSQGRFGPARGLGLARAHRPGCRRTRQGCVVELLVDVDEDGVVFDLAGVNRDGAAGKHADGLAGRQVIA